MFAQVYPIFDMAASIIPLAHAQSGVGSGVDRWFMGTAWTWWGTAKSLQNTKHLTILLIHPCAQSTLRASEMFIPSIGTSKSAVFTLILLVLSQIYLAASMGEANTTMMDVGSSSGAAQQPIAALPTRHTLRIAGNHGLDRILPYLTTYIRDPSAALNVEELIIDAEAPKPAGSFLRRHTPDPPVPSPEEIAVHDQIKAYIRSIGLSPEVTNQMIESFSCKVTPGAESDYYGHKNNKGYAATAAVILLSLCKNLTHLQIYGAEYTYFIRDFLLANNYGKLPAPSLQHLRHVRIESYTPSDSREYDRVEFLWHFRFFGRLPSIESYTANACIEYQIDLDLAPPGTSNIRKISITNADISSQVLGSIIRVPRALEEFTFSSGGLSHFEGTSAVLLPMTLGKCLLEHKDTLRVLDMDTHPTLLSLEAEEEDGPDEEEEDWDDEYPDPRIDEYWRLDEAVGNGKPVWSEELETTRQYGYSMGSLHDFVALEKLSVEIAALLGPPRPREGGDRRPDWYRRQEHEPLFRLVDALPPNLKFLRLYDYRRGTDAVWDENVDELKEKMAERFPLLVEVEGVDEPYVGNSQYGSSAGYDEVNPPPEVVKRNARWKEQYAPYVETAQ